MNRKLPRWTGDREAFADELIAWIERLGEGRYSEQVSQLEHALQCADLALREGAGDEEIVAALLHDVGHFIVDARNPEGPAEEDRRHEEVGARWLARCFPASVTDPILHHVPAKRYLCAVEPDYWSGLSPASKHSLELQGGPMSAAEVAEFEALPDAAAAVALRRRDDRGKVSGLEVPALISHRARVLGLLES